MIIPATINHSFNSSVKVTVPGIEIAYLLVCYGYILGHLSPQLSLHLESIRKLI